MKKRKSSANYQILVEEDHLSSRFFEFIPLSGYHVQWVLKNTKMEALLYNTHTSLKYFFLISFQDKVSICHHDTPHKKINPLISVSYVWFLSFKDTSTFVSHLMPISVLDLEC